MTLATSPQAPSLILIAAGNATYDYPRRRMRDSTYALNGREWQCRADSLGAWGHGKRLT
jgi:hypothetical protein